MKVTLGSDDALIVIDMQNDFLPGGSLAVAKGDEIIPLLNYYISFFHAHDLPVFATRDWHPPDHCSFLQQGGMWLPHCITETLGAAFIDGLEFPSDTHIISKAITQEKDAYSGFSDTKLNLLLKSLNVRRVFVGGIATDYCVLHTVKDALRYHYTVFILEDSVRAINKNPDDGLHALEEMVRFGATLINFDTLTA